MLEPEVITPKEAARLGAVSGSLYSRYFFAKTCRVISPPCHEEAWKLLDRPTRYKSLIMFRDGAKTTLTRLYGSRRIAYRRSRNILWLGKSEGHAQRSIEWIMRNVEYNRLWQQTFGLWKGTPWNGSEIDICGVNDDYHCRIIAMGITGSVRGINVDDFRPDTIVMDDICDPENTSTKEQRQTMEDLVFSDVYNSLAATSESPFAALISLATSLDPDDVNEKMQRDPAFDSLRFSIFDEAGESRWPQKWSTKELIEEKNNAIRNNRLSLWMREKECSFISRETAEFEGSWLQYYDILPEQFDGVVLSIDPVPPPSERQISKDLRDKDYEVLCVCGIYKGRYYLLDYCANKGHNPDWTLAKFFELLEKYRPTKCYVESVNYQRTLAWLIQGAMQRRKVYCQIVDKPDMRSKFDRIVDSLHGVTANKLLYVSKSHTDFIEQFTRYPKVSHDDVIEAVAVCVKALQSPEFQAGLVIAGTANNYQPLTRFRKSP